jgi:hypothetical protein
MEASTAAAAVEAGDFAQVRLLLLLLGRVIQSQLETFQATMCQGTLQHFQQ